MTISAKTLEFLKTVDTPTICNALEIVAPERRLTGYTVKPFVCPFPDVVAVVGYARVATCRATHANELTGEAARNQRIGYYEYIASGTGPTITVLQDLDGAEVGYGAFWGEVQSTVHKGLGSLGVITDGCIRDIPQWAPGFFALAGSLAPSHAFTHLHDFGKEVRVHGMVVKHGDLIHADRHGAVVIPTAVADKIEAACGLLSRKEAVILDQARAPGFNIEILKAALRKQEDIH
jgi:regulator of RNase E activity RraA